MCVLRVWFGYECVCVRECVCVHLICPGNRKMRSKMGRDPPYTNIKQY